MRTRDRPNFGKNKTLVKTTTFSIALLVAVIMITSTIPTIATPVNTPKVNIVEEVRGDPAGLDPNLAEKAKMASSLNNPDANPLGPLAEEMYGYNAYDGSGGMNEGPVRYTLEDPGTIEFIKDTDSGYFLAGGTWTCDEEWFGAEYNTGGLWKIDPDTGDMEQIGGGGTTCNGLAWDPVYNRMYGASGTHLIEYDIETGDQETIGSFGLSGKTIIGLAINLEGRAFIWDVLFSGSATLWEVDLATGEATEVGSMDQNLIYAQDGAFDRDDGTLWLAAYSGGGFLAKVDIETGELTNMGDFQGGAEIACSMFRTDCIPPEHDVGVVKILKPEASGHAVPSMDMELLVKNYGANPETFDAQMEIIKCESSGDFLLDEDFSAGIPADWETDFWEISYSNYASGTSPEASVYKYDQYYGGQYYDNYIMTGGVDATGWEKILMNFRWAADLQYPQYCNFYVKYRKNETSPWKAVQEWANPLGQEYEGDLYTIDCYGFGQELGENFTVMFQYVGYYYYYNYFYLDDITIEGCGGCAEYAELEKDIALDPGQETTITFPGWTPSEWHNESFQDAWETYPVHGFTIMDGDQRPRNNDKWKLLELYYPWFYDIEITEIGEPQEEGRSMPARTFDVEATITNVGQFESCCIGIDIGIGQPVVLDTLLSETEWPTTGFPYYYIYGPGYGSGWRDEHKNLVYYYGWRWRNGNNAGGDSPEAYLYYYYARADYHFYSAMIDTSEYASLQLNFLYQINHYAGSGLYALEAGYSHDGENWYAAWHEEPSSSGNGEVSVPIEGGSETTYIGFWVKGNPYYFNYWYIDNVELLALGFDTEYTDFMCQGDDLLPGESRVFNFDSWTPEHMATEETAWEIPYTAEATIDVTVDMDPGNDIKTNHFELDFWHDPALDTIDSPINGDRQELIWENGEPDGRNGLAGSYYYGYSNILIDDMVLEDDATATGGDFHFLWNSGSGTGNLDTVKVFFFQETGDCEPSEDEYAEVEVTSFSEETGGSYFGRTEIICTVEFDEVVLPAGTWYVGFQPDSSGEDLGYILTAESKGCECFADLPYFGYPRWSSSSYLWGQEYDLAFAVTGYKKGPPAIKAYIQPGTENIMATAINLGTFQELDQVANAQIWEYITDPDNGTMQYEDNETNIDLVTPLGGTVPLTFDPFTFAYEGRYGLFIEMPDANGDDDFPKNNKLRWGVGVDDTEPVSSHVLDPPVGDGEEGWYVSDCEVTLSAYDPLVMDVSSGVNRIEYQVNGGSVETITGPTGSFLITQADDNKDVEVKYWAVDNVENVENPVHTFYIDMDQTDPTIDLVYEVLGGNPIEGWDMLFTATANDLTSGMDRVMFYLNDGHVATVSGTGPTYEWGFKYYGDFKFDIRADAYDVAGNMASDLVEEPESYEFNQHSQSTQQKTVRIS